MLHVPYKGSAPAVTDLLGGQVHLLIDVAAVSQQHVKAGKLKALAITNTKRNAGFPELPTFDEVGLKGYQAIGWQGLFVPAGTPRPVIDRLADAVQKTMADPVVKEKFIAVGSEASPSGPEAFGAFMRAEIEKWSRIARTANVKVE
jgi:tripartite-type tricarboxylate transporter receptor subunit TctC